MMNAFDDFVNQHSWQCPEMPLVHTTKLKNLGGILGSHKLTKANCPHFGRSLIYMFYGRPAYRPKDEGNLPDSDFSICPITFIFKPARISGKAKRMFPHDTGAALNGLFAPTITAAEALNYEIQASIASLRKYVSRIFASNECYFLGKPDPALGLLEIEGSVGKFLSLMQTLGATSVDDRKYTAELHIEEDIPLRDILLAVVLPTAFLDKEEVRNAVIYEWGAIPITYDTYTGGIPQAYYQTVKQKVLDFYREHRLL